MIQDLRTVSLASFDPPSIHLDPHLIAIARMRFRKPSRDHPPGDGADKNVSIVGSQSYGFARCDRRSFDERASVAGVASFDPASTRHRPNSNAIGYESALIANDAHGEESGLRNSGNASQVTSIVASARLYCPNRITRFDPETVQVPEPKPSTAQSAKPGGSPGSRV